MHRMRLTRRSWMSDSSRFRDCVESKGSIWSRCNIFRSIGPELATILRSTNSSWSIPGRTVELDGADQVVLRAASSPSVSTVSGDRCVEHRFQLLGIRFAAVVGTCVFCGEPDRFALWSRLFVPDTRAVRIRQHIAPTLSEVRCVLVPYLRLQYRTYQVVSALWVQCLCCRRVGSATDGAAVIRAAE